MSTLMTILAVALAIALQIYFFVLFARMARSLAAIAREMERLNAAREPRPNRNEPAPPPDEVRQRLADALRAGTLSADSYAHQLRLLDARTARA